MSDHPPIPPKSEFCSKQDEGPDQEPSNWFNLIERPDTWMMTCLCHAKGRVRKVIAAVFEMEWRRLGERWDALNSRIIDKYTPFSRRPARISEQDSKRMDKYMPQSRAAYQAAEDWREWGEQK